MRRMKQRFPHMVSTRQIRQSVRRSSEVILERVTSDVSCGSQAKRPWIMRERGDTRKWWTCWWRKPLGCTGEAQCSGPMGISMDETWWNCWHWWEWKHESRRDSVSRYQGCLRIRCWTHDSWSLKTHCQIITSHRPTGQQLSTGEPRIWLNLQNWFGENTSDYQIMHGQNRTGMFIFCVWLSSALHGLKVTDWHAQA